jgi:hypothetical protein
MLSPDYRSQADDIQQFVQKATLAGIAGQEYA